MNVASLKHKTVALLGRMLVSLVQSWAHQQTAHVQVGGLKIFDKQLISVLNVAATVPGLVVTMLMVATQVMSPLQVATEEGGATLDHL